MNTTPSIDPRPRYFSRAYFRAVGQTIAADWAQANIPMRYYSVGLGLIFVALIALRVHAPFGAVGPAVLAGAILASWGFLLEVYERVHHWWDTQPVKILVVILGTMVVAFSTALASVIVNEATHFDPGHFPLSVAFVAPLTAGYLLAVLAWLAVLGGIVWFTSLGLVDMVRTGWAATRGRKHVGENPTLMGLRFMAVIVMAMLLGVTVGSGQRPYASFLNGAAQMFTYYLEMYAADACALPQTRMRRLNDEFVLDALAKDGRLAFQTRRCPLGTVLPTRSPPR